MTESEMGKTELESGGTSELEKMQPLSEKKTILVGIDSESLYAVEWAIKYLFSNGTSSFKMVVTTAKPTATALIGISASGTSSHIIPVVELDLQTSSEQLILRAKALTEKFQIIDTLFEIKEGDPKNVLSQAIEVHNANVLVVGSRGYGRNERALLGSVTSYCLHNVACNLAIVKQPKSPKTFTRIKQEGRVEIVAMVGLDESEYSFYALQWTLDHLFKVSSPLSRLVAMNVQPISSSSTAIGECAKKVLPAPSSNTYLSVTRMVERFSQEAKDLITLKGIALEAHEGDPRDVLYDVVQDRNISLLILGHKGEGKISRAVVGSVAEHLAHHALCSVMILKKPKDN